MEDFMWNLCYFCQLPKVIFLLTARSLSLKPKIKIFEASYGLSKYIVSVTFPAQSLAQYFQAKSFHIFPSGYSVFLSASYQSGLTFKFWIANQMKTN